MLKKLFFPATYKGHRFYKERILGITVDNNTIHCSIVETSSKKTTIVAVINEPIIITEGQSYVESLVKALTKVVAPLQKKVDKVCWGLSSSLALFKEVKLPFVDREKIAMVLEYEVESLLPFTLDEAIIDFIITKSIPEEKSSILLVAAVRKHEIQFIIDVCTQSGINPHQITLDVFGLVGIYNEISEYKKEERATALITLSAQSTRIVFIEKGTIRLIRTINQGIESIVNKVSVTCHTPPASIADQIRLQGLRAEGESPLSNAISAAFTELFAEIQFTLDTFNVKTNFSNAVTRCFFTGPYARINGLTTLASSTLQIPAELFSPEKLIVSRGRHVTHVLPGDLFDAVESIGLGCAENVFSPFNLRQKDFFTIDYAAGRTQIGATIAILVFFFGTLGVLSYAQTNLLQQRVTALEKKERKRLTPMIVSDGKKKPGNMSIKKLLTEAKKGIEQKQEMWAPLTQGALKPLLVLQELSKIIDRKRFDVAIESLIFNRDENGKVLVEISGSCKSRTGSDHFANFAEFEKNFTGSELLSLVGSPDPTATEDKGIKFVAQFKQK